MKILEGRKIHLCVLFGIISPFLFLSFTTVIFWGVRKPKDESDIDTTYEYKYLKYDPIQNVGTLGFVSSFEYLGENECISRIDDGGIHHLISRFEENEYKCTGQCFCENTRRGTTTIIKRNLVYFVSALSTYIAFDSSRKYFQEKCEQELESTCNGFVKSEVDDCEDPMMKGHIPWREPGRTYSFDLDKGDNKEDFEHRYYECQGSCLPRISESSYLRTLSRDYKCEKLNVVGCVIVNESPIGYEEQAKIEFQKEWLYTYCRRASTVQMQVKDSKDLYLCVSDYKGFNPTVTCVDIFTTFDSLEDDDDDEEIIDPDTINIDDLDLFGDEDEFFYDIEDVHPNKPKDLNDDDDEEEK